jgi:hypothetical protein
VYRFDNKRRPVYGLPYSFEYRRNETAVHRTMIFEYFRTETDTVIRFGAFLGVFAILSTAELFAPRRRLTISKSRRWSTNLTIVALNPLSVGLIYPVLPIGMALLASEQRCGLGTYKAQTAMGHTDMVIGLSQYRDPKKLSLPHLLILPFVGDPGRVPINRH